MAKILAKNVDSAIIFLYFARIWILTDWLGSSTLIIRICGRFMYKLYAFFGLDQIDRQTLECFFQFLPPYRQTKALRYRRETDRKTCVM